MTQDDFVTAVLRTQEQTNLDDFWPSDDLYKMVLHNGNMVLQELQAANQWSWLRKQLILGETKQHHHDHYIPEYQLPKWVNRVSTLYQDRLMLYPYKHHHCHGEIGSDDIIWRHPIGVPYSSRGAINVNNKDIFNKINILPNQIPDLKAVIIGDVITFNRPLVGTERRRAVVIDVQAEIPLFHICDDTCTDKDGNTPSYEKNDYRPCKDIPKCVLDFIPDKDYVIIQTAAYSAEGSEIAKDKQMNLQARADKRLSIMKESDVGATDVDQLEYEPFKFYHTL